jgi:VIT1/CCC1 family predicted Fe2+/Mn2+ transporter
VLPYLIFPIGAYLPAFFTMLGVIVLIISGFTFYISVVKEQKFFKHFIEMFLISVGVAVVSFAVGLLAKKLIGVDI